MVCTSLNDALFKKNPTQWKTTPHFFIIHGSDIKSLSVIPFLLFSGEMCYLAAMTGSLLSVTERKKRGKDIKQRLLLLHK